MTDLSYKNSFITKAFHEIDKTKADMKLEHVLPLTRREQKNYVELTSLRLVEHEYRMLFEKGVFLLLTSLYLLGILMADYSLFWFLSVVRFYGSQVDNKASATGSEGELTNSFCD